MTDNWLADSGENEAIRHFKASLVSGKGWYTSLLEAVRLWETPEEIHNGRIYRYLIDGEAFDWLTLAERLCEVAGPNVPEAEKMALLFYGEPPVELPEQEFQEFIGGVKHHQHLNYFYGVIAEEALAIAVEEEIRKERWAYGYHRDKDNTNEAFRRIYGATKTALLRDFRREKDYPQTDVISLTELKEFTYWLFKSRVKQSDKARVASDTRKALDWLKRVASCRRVMRGFNIWVNQASA